MNQEGGSLQTAPYLAITATSAPRRGHSGGKRGSRRSWGKCFMEGGGTQYPIFNVQYPITNGTVRRAGPARSPFPNLGGFASWRETGIEFWFRPARRFRILAAL